MKICLYADPHWSSYSSIVRRRGEKYSVRIENLLQTINWIEGLASHHSCDSIICLGDFFDKSDLTSEELTALSDIQWSNINHVFLVGNHEMGRSSLEFSSSHLFHLANNSTVIDYPQNYVVGNTEICFLPYVLDHSLLSDYFRFELPPERRVIFSHNDIKGIQMGQFLSTEGFDLEDINTNCGVFFNGHLHNHSQYGNVINVGNITGQNFGEDASKFKHSAIIFDTETFKMQYYENPWSMNFYKLDFTNYSKHQIDVVKDIIESLKNNSVVTVKVLPDLDEAVRKLLTDSNKVIESRVMLDIIASPEITPSVSTTLTVDHLSQFSNYIQQEMGTSAEVLEELHKVVAI